METYNLALATKKIYDSKLTLFSLKTLRDILEVRKESTLYGLLKRLLKNEVILKIEKNKYQLKNAKVNDFVLANFLYQPSYISLESALNFYGVLAQFPYEITSCTTKKPKTKNIADKSFVYIHLKRELFWGYEKRNDFLIALPEKALLDQIYLSSKGIKKLNLDEYDLSKINLANFKKYLKNYPKIRQFQKVVQSLKQFIPL